MADYLPRSDSEFRAWVTTFVTYANANLATLGLVAADLTLVTQAQTTFNAGLDAHLLASASAAAARETKDAAGTTLDQRIRVLVRRLQANPSLTNAHRQALGITVPADTRTSAPVPASRPVADIDTSQRLTHVIAFSDEGGASRPDGVAGCQIWMKIGDPAPADLSEMLYVATATRSGYAVQHGGENGGKRVYYALRWINTRGQTGPWSLTVSSTIVA